MKRSFRIIVWVLISILFITSVVWTIGICTNHPMSFMYILGYTSAIIFGVSLFLFGVFGLCELGDWAFKKD